MRMTQCSEILGRTQHGVAKRNHVILDEQMPSADSQWELLQQTAGWHQTCQSWEDCLLLCTPMASLLPMTHNAVAMRRNYMAPIKVAHEN